MALPGDLRVLSTNPAGLVEMAGIEVYHRNASRYYLFETSTFSHIALGSRLTDRLAFAARYDQDELTSEVLTLGDPFGIPAEPVRPKGVFGAALGYRITPGLSVGASVANLHPNDEYIATPHVGLSVAHRLERSRTGKFRSLLRGALGVENIFSASVDRTLLYSRGFMFHERYDLPVNARAGVSARWSFHHGWLHDSLPSLAFTVQVQYDDDLISPIHTALRAGCEVEVLGMLSLRAGWYTMGIDDHGWPQTQKSTLSDLTYGAGLRAPLQAMLGARLPLTATFDYCALPQPSFSVDELSPFTEAPWENFKSWSVRLAYGIGPVVKKKAQGTSATGP
jgi:hypothetical protein